MKKVCILTWHDISNAYSCLSYLSEKLSEKCVVDIYGFAASDKMPQQLKGKYYSFVETWYGKIKRFRVYAAKIHAYQLARKYDVLIVNDLDFFRIAYYAKKKKPQLQVVHYNTEIHDVDIVYPKHTVKFYEQHASFPDMIVECLPERAEYRKTKYNISKDIFVIDNTLPSDKVEDALNANVNVDRYFDFVTKDIPTLIYAGGCNLTRNLGDVLKCAPAFDGRVNFLFLCYGTEKEFEQVKAISDQYSNCYLYHAVNRVTLLNILERCDIGIQYYDPRISINHRLAAPSKFYEYISVGLNVISSENQGIDRMISQYDLGVCFSGDEGIGAGLEKLLTKGLNNKSNIKKCFKESLCYEVISKEAINKIYALIGE